MNLKSPNDLTETQVQKGLQLVVKDGLASEAMNTFTGGTFLVSIALFLGASNFQLGLLAALPTLANIFQMVAIYLVGKYANRRTVTVVTALISRFPLLLIGILPFLFPPDVSLNLLIGCLFFHYSFGAISGTSWNSWMKDLVPEKILGSFFSNRTRLIQILSVSLSFALASGLDYIKENHQNYLMVTYSAMFVIGGIAGLSGLYLLSKTPEPKFTPVQDKIFALFKNPIKNKNYRNLIAFSSLWTFALNLATPFFGVYMMKMLHLPLKYIVGLGVLSQVTHILFIRIWGRISDKYSNKMVLHITAPIYIACIIAWTFTTMPGVYSLTIPLLFAINILTGISTSGINLALSNIGIKLAPKNEAIVYLSVKGMINAFFAGIAPLLAGLLVDFFSTKELNLSVNLQGLKLHLFALQNWDFFFMAGAVLAIISLFKLSKIQEAGEEKESKLFQDIFIELKGELISNFLGLKNIFLSTLALPSVLFSMVTKPAKPPRVKRIIE